MVKEGQRKRGSDRPSIIMVGSFAGKVRLNVACFDTGESEIYHPFYLTLLPGFHPRSFPCTSFSGTSQIHVSLFSVKVCIGRFHRGSSCRGGAFGLAHWSGEPCLCLLEAIYNGGPGAADPQPVWPAAETAALDPSPYSLCAGPSWAGQVKLHGTRRVLWQGQRRGAQVLQAAGA